MATNQAVCGIFPSPLLSPHFLVYYLKAKKSYFLNLAAGGAQSNISQNIIKDTLIPILPLPEQQKIVEELDCLSNMIELKKKQLETYDKLAQAIFYDMFGDPITNEKGWEIKRLGDISIVNPSKRSTTQGLMNEDVISFLPMEDLPIKACYHTPYQTRMLHEVQSSYTCFADNDVIMAKVSPCFENGKIGIPCNLKNGIGYGSSELIVIRPDKTLISKEYIYFTCQTTSFKANACGQLTGTSGLRRVPKSYVENCKISIPPLPLQQQFAEKIESIEKQKDLIKKSLQEVETLFNSRMDYYFN